mmetsp:Transcript_1618/g.3507  ORF Transcript_1618/g.3507 Transcript_1618/m.3507 type:complete len:280 (+) Transcript_1618:169-1008(+)
MHLDPFQVNCCSSHSLPHLDSITSAVLAVRSGQMHQIRSVLAKERIRCKIRTKPTRGEDDGPEDLDLRALTFVLHSNDGTVVRNQVRGTSLGDDLSHVPSGVLLDLLNHLDQSVRDGHAGESLFASVSPGCRMPPKTCHQRQIQSESVHEPVHGRTRFVHQYLGNLGFLRTTLQRVAQKQLVGIIDALRFLSLGCTAIDAAGCLGGVAAAKRRLVEHHHFSTKLQNSVSSSHTSQAAADDDGGVGRKISRRPRGALALGHDCKRRVWFTGLAQPLVHPG